MRKSNFDLVLLSESGRQVAGDPQLAPIAQPPPVHPVSVELSQSGAGNVPGVAVQAPAAAGPPKNRTQ
jgi:hypothetical protein